MREVYVVLTHVANDFVIGNIQKMRCELGSENVFVVNDHPNTKPFQELGFQIVDWTQGDSTAVINGPVVFVTSQAYFKSVNALHAENRNTYETAIVSVWKSLAFDVDYLWFIENDVACNGNWKATLGKCASSVDFLATCVERWTLGSTWEGWNSLHHYDVVWHERWKAFVPISRYSKAALQCLDQNLGRLSGWVETYLATVAYQHGLRIGNLPADMFADWWTFQSKDVAFFRQCCNKRPNENKLYHGIKQLVALA